MFARLVFVVCHVGLLVADPDAAPDAEAAAMPDADADAEADAYYYPIGTYPTMPVAGAGCGTGGCGNVDGNIIIPDGGNNCGSGVGNGGCDGNIIIPDGGNNCGSGVGNGDCDGNMGFIWDQACIEVDLDESLPDNKPICVTVPWYTCTMEMEQRDTVTRRKQKCEKVWEERCWTYETSTCKRVDDTTRKLVTWEDDVLGSTSMESKCYTVTKCRFEEGMEQGTYQVPQYRLVISYRKKKEFRIVMVPQQPKKVTTTVWEVIYKKECNNVQRHVCVNNDCNDYGCAGTPGRNDILQQTGSSGGCGSQGVLPPYTGDCCPMLSTPVCQQRPIKVPRTVTKIIQMPPINKKEYYWVKVPVKKYKVEMVTKTFSVPSRKCFEESTEECRKIETMAEPTKISKTKNIMIGDEKCERITEQKEHCAKVYVRDECQEETSQQPIHVKKNVCRPKPNQQCFNTNSYKCMKRRVKQCHRYQKPMPPANPNPVPPTSPCNDQNPSLCNATPVPVPPSSPCNDQNPSLCNATPGADPGIMMYK